MVRKEKKLQKIKQTQEQIKRVRQDRINKGLPAQELQYIEKNLYLHNFLYTIMKIFNSMYKKDFEKRFYNFENRPIIFASNHVRMQDIAIEMEAIYNHMVLLSGDFKNVHSDISGKLLEKNGIIYFDMQDPYNDVELISDKQYLEELNEYINITNSDVLKEEYEIQLKKYNNKLQNIINDRKNVKSIISDVLTNGYNMLWYYEGSWNFSENKPYYDGYNYIVQAAVDTNAIVVPIAFDIIDNGHLFNRRKACVRFGKPIDYRRIYGNKLLSKEEKNEGLDLLKGQIGYELMFNIWKEHSAVKRDVLAKMYSKKLTAQDYFVPDYKRPSPLRSYWDKYIKKALKEWKFTEEDIEKKHFVDKDVVEQKDVLKHLDNLNLNKNNAFLLSKRNHH